jgi:PLP dependent protein
LANRGSRKPRQRWPNSLDCQKLRVERIRGTRIGGNCTGTWLGGFSGRNPAVAAALAEGSRDNPLRVYVQVSLDGDASRGGVDVREPGAVDDVCGRVQQSKCLELVGLMGIPPLDWDPDEAFGRLQSEHRRVLESHPSAVGLSAGMSDDLEIAVKHGSTCVRVGTALLGPRRLPSP